VDTPDPNPSGIVITSEGQEPYARPWRLATNKRIPAHDAATQIANAEGLVTAVIYERTTHAGPAQFTVPVAAQAAFDFDDGDEVYVVVEDPSTGERLFEGPKTLESGPEIYGPDIRAALASNQLIRVTVSRPTAPYRHTTRERPITPTTRHSTTWHEAVGTTYTSRAEIHQRYGGQTQGGISTPASTPFILLFTGASGEHYGHHDGWNDEGVFLYTGEGQRGDMAFKGGNAAIRDHSAQGKALHLFQSLGKGHGYRYEGEFVCASWSRRRAPDLDANTRTAIVFNFLPTAIEPLTDDAPRALPTLDLTGPDLAQLRREALEASRMAPEATSEEAKQRSHERSWKVRIYVLARSTGQCEACGAAAPFQRQDGTPYLEPHHTKMISEGGPDHIRFVGAVCPNCHREIHYGAHGNEKNERLQKYLSDVEHEA